MTIAVEVAKRLLEIKAIKLNPQDPFTWASGIKSPIYCDNRIILSHPEIRTFVKKCLVEAAKEFGLFDAVAGVATSGIAFGMLLADVLSLPFVYVRNAAKGHGRQNQIEGELSGSENVLVVEDLVSTGGSALKAVEVLRGRGCRIAGVLAIFTYGLEKAKEAFAKADCRMRTLSNYDEVLLQAIENQYIKKEDLDKLNSWRIKISLA